MPPTLIGGVARVDKNHWNRLESILIAGPEERLLSEFNVHHRFKSCVYLFEQVVPLTQLKMG